MPYKTRNGRKRKSKNKSMVGGTKGSKPSQTNEERKRRETKIKLLENLAKRKMLPPNSKGRASLNEYTSNRDKAERAAMRGSPRIRIPSAEVQSASQRARAHIDARDRAARAAPAQVMPQSPPHSPSYIPGTPNDLLRAASHSPIGNGVFSPLHQVHYNQSQGGGHDPFNEDPVSGGGRPREREQQPRQEYFHQSINPYDGHWGYDGPPKGPGH